MPKVNNKSLPSFTSLFTPYSRTFVDRFSYANDYTKNPFGSPSTNKFIEFLTKNQRLEICSVLYNPERALKTFKEIVGPNKIVDELLFCDILESGNVALVKYIVETKRVVLGHMTFNSGVISGNLDLVKYLCTVSQIQKYPTAFKYSLMSGNKDIVQMIFKCGLYEKGNTEYINTAICSGSAVCVLFASLVSDPVYADYLEAVKTDNLEIIKAMPNFSFKSVKGKLITAAKTQETKQWIARNWN